MSTTRDELHRLVDILPEKRLGTAAIFLLRLAAEEEGIVVSWAEVQKALGTPHAPGPGEGNLDAMFAANSELRRQFEESIEELKAGRPLIPHEALARVIRHGQDG